MSSQSSRTRQAADAAVEALKLDGVASNDAIGVLVLDANGKVKTDKVGSHSAGKGAGIGFVLGLLGPVGWGLGLGIGMGATTGAVLGLLHHKGLGLHEADRDRISAALTDGKAAVGVLTPGRRVAGGRRRSSPSSAGRPRRARSTRTRPRTRSSRHCVTNECREETNGPCS